MGIQDLQAYLDGSAEGCSQQVDLLRIARTIAQKQQRRSAKISRPTQGFLRLVVDGECCLDRLYGGYFSDWTCGGQWNRMVQFLSVLVQTVQSSHIDLAIFFNGCLEQQRMGEWVVSQQRARQRVNQILKHINTKGTPPPKVWWISPVCLRTCLRMALRHLGISVLCTMDDHHQEVIGYCREYNFHGLVADDGEYAVFDPPRYFSSEQLKLTYKGSLETKEYNLNEMVKALNLSPDRFFVFAALLGNYLLTEQDLADFYRKINILQGFTRVPSENFVKTIANFVKNLQSVDNLDNVAIQVFGQATDKRTAKLKQSVQYYMNGTKDGFLRYRLQASGRHGDGHPPAQTVKPAVNSNKEKENSEELDTSKFASETKEVERDSLALYKEATAHAAAAAPQIVIDPPTGKSASSTADTANTKKDCNSVDNKTSPTVNGSNHVSNLLISSSSSSSSSSATSPSRLAPDASWGKGSKNAEDAAQASKHCLPSVSPEVMRTASERHQKGLMSPYIYQILTQGEIKLPVLMEDEIHREIPSVHLVYRPVRQMVYAILFNLHHYVYMATKGKEKEKERDKDRSKNDHEKNEIPDLKVKEWIWSKSNPYQSPDLVKAEQIGWGVPTIQRLWFGGSIDDKRRRLRAFLTCMRSDTPLMLNPAYVPQHLLVMATVLRYIMSLSKPVLRKPELDAFIVQAFSPELMNAQYLQELQVQVINSRGVQLAALFMAGVETALLANDACGAPVPWLMCCPWLFFDGKLFHHKLERTSQVKNLLELCDHRIEHVVKVERMRKAVLEGLDVQFARPPLPPLASGPPMRGLGVPPPASIISPPGHMHPQQRALLSYPTTNGVSRGLLRRPVPARGGQLEIAGVVVGSWGPNYGSRMAGVRLGPQLTQLFLDTRNSVTSVGGGVKSYRQSGIPIQGLNSPGRPSYQTRAGKGVGRGKKNQNQNKKKNAAGSKKIIQREPIEKGKGRGLTIEGEDSVSTLTVAEILGQSEGGCGEEQAPKKPPASSPDQFEDALATVPPAETSPAAVPVLLAGK
ncbi:constitutive coactivator of PPAR-gamma-like protein 1 homolog isoform X2 [Bacillus rossius redtenbacheri]|uniref:constitutive coactivator of PPAR-gamma-like protein 1 homolog isoform X2 n=1 Tax=Bacillus rossius redtenbacheri TaxID=93214 RepID=UPI002FDD3DDF